MARFYIHSEITCSCRLALLWMILMEESMNLKRMRVGCGKPVRWALLRCRRRNVASIAETTLLDEGDVTSMSSRFWISTSTGQVPDALADCVPPIPALGDKLPILLPPRLVRIRFLRRFLHLMMCKTQHETPPVFSKSPYSAFHGHLC